MLLSTRSCRYENFVFLIGQYHVKDTPISLSLQKKNNKQKNKSYNGESNPGLKT